MKKLVILGIGGNSADVLDTVNEINAGSKSVRYECIGFLDDNRDIWGKGFCGVKVLGPLDSAPEFQDAYFIFMVGSPSNYWKRDQIAAKANIPLERFETIVHPSASVSRMAELGYGAAILQNVTIASNVRIGNHVMILPNSVISHDDTIGDYTCIAGGVCISGGVNVGKLCYLGTNSSIIGNVTVGDYSMIGMGSVILGHVPSNSVYVGNPGRFLRHTRKDK